MRLGASSASVHRALLVSVRHDVVRILAKRIKLTAYVWKLKRRRTEVQRDALLVWVRSILHFFTRITESNFILEDSSNDVGTT